jgi:hypothetical protein
VALGAPPLEDATAGRETSVLARVRTGAYREPALSEPKGPPSTARQFFALYTPIEESDNRQP